MCLHVYVCTCMQRPEADAGCLSTSLRAHGFGSSSQFAPQDCLAPTPIGWDYGLFHGWCEPNSDRHAYRVLTLSHLPSLNLLFIIDAGDWTRGLHILGKHPTIELSPCRRVHLVTSADSPPEGKDKAEAGPTEGGARVRRVTTPEPAPHGATLRFLSSLGTQVIFLPKGK